MNPSDEELITDIQYCIYNTYNMDDYCKLFRETMIEKQNVIRINDDLTTNLYVLNVVLAYLKQFQIINKQLIINTLGVMTGIYSREKSKKNIYCLN